MFHFADRIVSEADAAAQAGGLSAALAGLRKLSLEDFGQLMWSMPNPRYPNLSALLPRMASVETQKKYTGQNGIDLLKNTLAFIRLLENNYVRHTGKYLRGETVLDFGVGYGRMVRLLYYYTDPANIWGLDPMAEPMALCAEAGILGNIRQSESVPSSLPTDGRTFDLAYSFSVFSHLSPLAADPCLAAVRDVMNPGGLFMLTVWPPEIWPYLDKVNGTNRADEMKRMFAETGHAYFPHGGEMGRTYGNATISFDFFRNKGWDLLGYDSSLIDPYQITLVLKKN
jgi:SAM-dependent methyltransferase